MRKALTAQVFKNREFAWLRRQREIATDRPSALIGNPDRAVRHGHRDIWSASEQAFGGALAELPKAAEGKYLRMQDRNAGRDARHIDTGSTQLVSERFQEFVRIGAAARLGHQPVDDRMGLIACGERWHDDVQLAPSMPRFSAARAATRCSEVMWVATMRIAVASTAASSVKPSTGSMSGTKSNGRMK